MIHGKCIAVFPGRSSMKNQSESNLNEINYVQGKVSISKNLNKI